MGELKSICEIISYKYGYCVYVYRLRSFCNNTDFFLFPKDAFAQVKKLLNIIILVRRRSGTRFACQTLKKKKV